jgi:hypothetical protein
MYFKKNSLCPLFLVCVFWFLAVLFLWYLNHQTESVERVEWWIAPCSDGLELTACYSGLLEYRLAVEAALADLWLNMYIIEVFYRKNEKIRYFQKK